MTGKLVVCKGYYGLGGNLAVLLCAKRLADSLGRELIVDWRNNRNYGLSDADIFSELFDAHGISSFDKSLSDLSVWPEYWQAFIDITQPYVSEFPLTTVRTTDVEELPESEINKYDVIVITRDDTYWHSRSHVEEFFKASASISPKKEIMSIIDEFQRSNFYEYTIGVHIRHGNGERTVIPPDINWYFENIDERTSHLDDFRVFVCTDCIAVVHRFEDRYPNKVIHTDKEYLPLGSGGMHFAEGDQARLNSAIEAVVDIWLLSRSSMIIGSKSFFSRLAIILNFPNSKDKSFVWQPEIRSHKPYEGQYPISEMPDLLEHLQANNILTDGLFTSSENGEISLFYLCWKLTSFSDMEHLDISSVYGKLLNFRSY